MPDRPQPPSVPREFNDLGSRLRALEREQREILGGSGVPLETFENGSPLGPTRFLDFGPGLHATLIGDDFVRVSGAAGGEGGWDAIVDGTIAASDPNNRLFLGIGEALTYLSTTVGLTRAFVLVRGFNGSYTETADFTCPAEVHLVGTPSWMNAAGGSAGVTWHLGAFGGTLWTGLAIHDMFVDIGAKTHSFFGKNGSTTHSPNVFVGQRVGINNNSSAAIRLANSYTVVDVGVFSGLQQVQGGEFIAYFSDAQFLIRGSSFSAMLSNAAQLFMHHCMFSVQQGLTMTLPQTTIIRGFNSGNGWSWGNVGGGGPLVFQGVNSGKYDIEISDASQSAPFTASFGGLTDVEVTLRGVFGDVTVGAPPAFIEHRFDLRCSLFDITGPAIVSAQLAGQAFLRGPGIAGTITTLRASDTALNYVDCDRSALVVSPERTSYPAGSKPYDFDAASTNNVLIHHGLSLYPVVGTDAGTNNRVLPEDLGTGGPGGTPGDVFVGIEDEGVNQGAVNNFDFVGAGVTAAVVGNQATITIPGGTTIDGHVIEDEGTPLTQRANLNFVGAGVTVTDSAPDTIVTIPGGSGGLASVIDDPIYRMQVM